MNALEPENFSRAAHIAQQLRAQLNQQLLGQPDVVDQVLIALFAGGHVLLEGVPGLGKTLLVRTLAECFAGEFKRIQFTPDLMPADITGHVLYDMKESRFRIRRGPIFTNLLLADEINRAPAKTQAALLEVMQEEQVTIEGNTQAVPQPFMVLATQNPIDHEGTYALPEAELDRFFMKIYIDYPALDDEIAIAKAMTAAATATEKTRAAAIVNADEVVMLQKTTAAVTVDDQVFNYAVRLVRATREHGALLRGAGTRACIALIRCARARALLRGENFVLPDDIKAIATPVMRHRIALASDVEIDGFDADSVLEKVYETVAAPRL